MKSPAGEFFPADFGGGLVSGTPPYGSLKPGAWRALTQAEVRRLYEAASAIEPADEPADEPGAELTDEPTDEPAKSPGADGTPG